MSSTAFLLSRRFLPYRLAIFSVLFRFCLKLSTSPFAFGWWSGTPCSPDPSCLANSLNFLYLKGGPLWLSCLLHGEVVFQSLLVGLEVSWWYRLYHWISGFLQKCSVHLGTIHHVLRILFPRAAWAAGHLDWFFSVSFRSYLALIMLVNNRVKYAVHQWKLAFFSQHLLGLSFS